MTDFLAAIIQRDDLSLEIYAGSLPANSAGLAVVHGSGSELAAEQPRGTIGRLAGSFTNLLEAVQDLLEDVAVLNVLRLGRIRPLDVRDDVLCTRYKDGSVI